MSNSLALQAALRSFGFWRNDHHSLHYDSPDTAVNKMSHRSLSLNAFLKLWARDNSDLEIVVKIGILIIIPVGMFTTTSIQDYDWFGFILFSVVLSVMAWLYVFGFIFHSLAKDRLYEEHRVPNVKYSTIAKVDAMFSVVMFFSAIAYAVTINQKLCTLPHMGKFPNGPCMCLVIQKSGAILPTGCPHNDPNALPPLVKGNDGTKFNIACCCLFLASFVFFFKGLFSYFQHIKGNGEDDYYAVMDTSEKPYNTTYEEIGVDDGNGKTIDL